MRNQFRGPHYIDFDMGLYKTFQIKEKITLGVGATAFNAFNHPNFNLPDNNLGSATFGQSSSTQGVPAKPRAIAERQRERSPDPDRGQHGRLDDRESLHARIEERRGAQDWDERGGLQRVRNPPSPPQVRGAPTPELESVVVGATIFERTTGNGGSPARISRP